MIQQMDRFTCSPVYRQALIQEGCPVYVHCSRICTDRRTADRFLQLRLVNRCDSVVETLILSIDGYDVWGEPCGKISGLLLPNCGAQPHSIFGEDRLIALGKLRAAKIEVTVEHVSFFDGMLWRCRAANNPRPLEETDWELCTCGLPNEPQQERCDLCARPLAKPAAEVVPVVAIPVVTAEEATLPVPAPVISRPEPVLRSAEDLQESFQAFALAAEEYEPMDEEDDGVPRWLFVLLCVIGGVALLAALAFLFYFLKGSQML